MTWAESNKIAADQIMGIRQWLPEMWNKSDELDWMSDKELLSELDQQVSVTVEKNEAPKLAQSKVWLAIQRRPWPNTLSTAQVSVADELGIEIPMVTRTQALLSPNRRLPSSELKSLFHGDSQTDAERKLVANFIVLYGLPIVQFAHDGGTRLTGSAYSRASEFLVDRGGSRQLPFHLANSLFASSDLWINRLDEMRSTTLLPKSMDVLIQCLLTFILKGEKNPELIAGIAIPEPESKLSEETGSLGLRAGGMGGFGTPKPSPEDKVKAKRIAEVLSTYLQKHVR